MSPKKRKTQEEVVEDTDHDGNIKSSEHKKKKKKNKNKENRKELESISVKDEEELFEECDKPHEEAELMEEYERPEKENEVESEKIEEWPKEDILELIRRIEKQIPEKDSLRYTSRAEKLDWHQIQFGAYSAGGCYKKWKIIAKKIRSYRLLSEIVADAKVWADKPWTDFYSRGKKKRHPDHPARPLSSYMLFYMAQKNKVAKSNPDMKMTEVSKIIGEKYNALPEHKKAKYVEMAKKMQETYRTELDKFYEKHPEEIPKPKKQENSRNRREAGAPAKPLTPFKLFYNDRYEKHKDDEDFDQHAFLEKCKDQWKKLSDKKKTVWIKWALEEEAKYMEDMAAYASAHNEEMPQHPAKSVLTKEEKALLDRMSGKPEKPPNSAYSLFSRLKLQNSDMKSGDTPRNRMKEIAKEWGQVPPQEKLKYSEKVQHMLETYKLEFANYLESLPPERRAEELAKNQPRRKVTVKSKAQPVKEQVKQKMKIKARKLFKGEPEPPPSTVFDLFLQHFSKENSHLSPQQCEIQAVAQWKKLSQSEKDKYQKKREQAKSEYMKQYETFILSLSEAELKEYSVKKSEEDKMRSEPSSGSSEDSEEDSEDSSDEKETNKEVSSSNSSSSDND